MTGFGIYHDGKSGINWKNRAEILLKMDNVSKKNSIYVSDCLYALLGKFIIELDKRIPRDTGEYAHSWFSEVEGMTIKFRTYLTALALWLEVTGVRPHDIYPLDPTGVLHWVDELGEHFAKMVHHTGFDPKPHIFPAKKETLKEAKWILRSCFKKHFGQDLKVTLVSRDIPLEHYISVGKTGRLA